MEDYLSKLKKDVQCSLCNNTLTEPKILPCFHTFCKPCIKRHAELIEEANVFKCPKCKSETPLPDLSSVDDLKPSLLHSRIVKVLEFVESEKVCSVSGSHPPASWHCFDCNRSLCDECERSYSLFTKDHKTTSLNNLKKEDVVFMLRGNYCRDHAAKNEFYCKDCGDCLCLECLRIRNCRIHNTIQIQDFISSKQSRFQEAFDHLKGKQEGIQKQVEMLKEITKTAKESGRQAKAEVKMIVKRLISSLEESEQELEREVEKKIEKAEQNESQGRVVVDQTQSFLEYICNVMENGQLSEIDAALEDIEGYDNRIDVNPNRQEFCFEFVCSKEVNKIMNSQIGILKPMLTDTAMSLIQVKPEDLEVLKKSALVVLTKTSSGKLNADPDDVVDVKITPKNDVKIETENVRTDGKVKVEFMAKVAGQLTAEVQVNGNHVSNSPLVLNMKPREMRRTRKFNIKGLNTQPKQLSGITVNKENSRIAVADLSSHCVYVCNTNGDLLLKYGGKGSGEGQLNSPQGLAFLNNTDLVIADRENHRICIVNTTTGRLIKTFGNQGNEDGQFLRLNGIHVDEDGNIMVCDRVNHRVQVFSKEGVYQYQFGLAKDDNFSPVCLVTHGGLFYMGDYNHVIHVFEKKGKTRISTFGGKGSADGQLNGPCGLAIDNDQHLLVCDRGNKRIQKFTLDGRLLGSTCNKVDDPMYITVMNDGKIVTTILEFGVYFVE